MILMVGLIHRSILVMTSIYGMGFGRDVSKLKRSVLTGLSSGINQRQRPYSTLAILPMVRWTNPDRQNR